MDNPITFLSALVRLSSYATVMIVSYFTIKNKLNRPKIFFVGDIVVCVGLALAIIAETWFKYDIFTVRNFFATPAVFIWSLTRIADFFSKESRDSLRIKQNKDLKTEISGLRGQMKNEA